MGLLHSIIPTDVGVVAVVDEAGAVDRAVDDGVVVVDAMVLAVVVDEEEVVVVEDVAATIRIAIRRVDPRQPHDRNSDRQT